MKNMLYLLTLYFILMCNIYCDNVCTLKMLRTEVYEDLADNKMLDCARRIPKQNGKSESENQKNTRIKAQWDTACSFEASQDWMSKLRENYGIPNLVDSQGNPVGQDFEDQADMCEIVRAAIAARKFPIQNLDWRHLKQEEIVNYIGCVGSDEEKSICAVTNGSFFDHSSWEIFLSPAVIKFAGQPSVSKNPSQPQGYSTNIISYISENKNQMENYITGLLSNPKSILDLNKPKEPSNNPNNPNNPKSPSPAGGSKIHIYAFDKPENLNSCPTEFDVLENNIIHYIPKIESTVFAFYMVAYTFSDIEVLKLKLLANGMEMKASYQFTGPLNSSSISGSFIKAVNNSTSAFSIVPSYSIMKKNKINPDGQSGNLSFGAVAFPKSVSLLFKLNSFVLEVGSEFKELTDVKAELTVDNKNKEAYFIVTSNISCYTDQVETLLHTLITITDDKDKDAKSKDDKKKEDEEKKKEEGEKKEEKGKEKGENGQGKEGKDKDKKNGNDQPDTKEANEKNETISTIDSQNYLSTNTATVLKLKEGEKKKVTFKYKLESSNVIDPSNPNSKYADQALTISAVELPQGTKVNHFKLKNPSFTLNTSNIWKSFGINAKINVTETKKILILYHYNVEISKNTQAPITFKSRLVVNKAFARRSLLITKNTKYATGQGYVLEQLPVGEYSLDIEFLSNSPEFFTSKGIASLTVIQLPFNPQ